MVETLMFTIQKIVKKEIGNKKANKYLKSKKNALSY